MATPLDQSSGEPTIQRFVRAFRSHFKMLVDVLDPEEAALALYQEKLISKTTLEEAIISNGSKFKRSYKVVDAMETYLGICTSTTTAHRILTILERNSTSSGPDSVIARIRRQASGSSEEEIENYTPESPGGSGQKLIIGVGRRVSSEFSHLKQHFASMMMVGKRLLVQKQVDISELKERLLFSHRGVISRDSLSAANSIEKIFDDVIFPRCTVTNYFLLSSLADELDIPGITVAIEKYEKSEEKFNTCLLEEDFAGVVRKEIERHESSDSELPRTELKLKVDWANNEVTLTEFRSLVREVFPGLCRWIDLEVVNEGCICFTCFAPKHLEGVLIQMAEEQREVAMKKGVILLEVGGTVIFDKTTATQQAPKLWQACLDGDLVTVNETLRKGADFNWKRPDNELYTPLHVATHCEHEQIVKVLLDHGADPNTISENEYSPLITACEMEFKVLVEHLLEHDANPDLEGTAGSALHVAMECDNKEIAELLLTANATIDKRNKEGETPLHTAARNGHTGMVHFLISKNANIDAKDKMGHTVLHYAAMHDHPDVVELLLNKGADPDTLSKNGFSPLISAAKSGSKEIVQQLMQWSSSHGGKIDLFQDGPEGNSALHFASDQGNIEVMKLLLCEENLDKLNQDGDTPLHLATRKGHVHIVKLLVKHGANKSIQNKEGKTPIQLAKENKDQLAGTEITRILLSIKHSFKQEDPQPCTQSIDEALWKACHENNVDQTRKLLLQGANQYWKNREHFFKNFSCLDIAVYCNHTEVAKILLENVDQVTESAFHLAASYGRAEAAESLISAGADVDAFDEDENTPLHNAAAYGHLDTVKLLVQKRAQKRKNKEMLSPLEVAQKRKHADVIKFLEEDVVAAFEAEVEERKQIETKLKQLEAEKERVASVAQKTISDLNDELQQKEQLISSQSCELTKLKVAPTPSAASPEMHNLIHLKLKTGSSLSIVEFIASNQEFQCIDFAQLLLKNIGQVQGLHDSCNREIDLFVRAVLGDWLDTADCNWGDLTDAMEKAKMDERTVKAIRENFGII